MSFPRRALLALAISMAVPVCAAQAATFNVPNGDVAALKSAIKTANSNGQNDIINLASGGSYAIVSVDNTPARTTSDGPADGENGLPILKADGRSSLTFNGNGATIVRQAPSFSAPGYRFFTVEAGAQVNFDAVTLQNGFFANGQSTVGGAAILNRGSVFLRGCTFTGNRSSPAGAILNLGALTVESSTFTNNNTDADAGAILSRGSAASLSINASTFANNSGGEGGALYVRDSDATVRLSTFRGNSAIGSGGAISIGGQSATLAAQNNTFDSNRASNQSGGGIIVRDATAKIEGCTFVKNYGYNGGGLSSSGQLTLLNSTFSANIAQGYQNQSGPGGYNGGGLEITPSSVTSPNTLVDSCTFFGNISDNPRAFTIGGIAASSSPLTLRNSIVVGNADKNALDIGGNISSGGHNLVGETGSSGFVASDKLNVADAKLGPLADNGGPTQTIALLAGSPALNAGQTALTEDQRGVARPQGNADDIGAYESEVVVTPPAETPSLIVTTLQDVAANDGLTSLREAIDYSNVKAGADAISFADNVRGTITLNGTQLPIVTGELAIAGPGSSQITIDANSKSRILQVSSAGKLTLSGLSLTRGDSGGGTSGGSGDFNGGSAIISDGTLVLIQVNLSGNNNTAVGGAIRSSGTLTLVDSILNSNSCYRDGGAIYNTGDLMILRSSFNGNRSVITSGGAISNGGTATIIDSTFGNNSADGDFSGSSSNTSASGGAIISGGTLNMRGCTLSGNKIATRTNGTFCGGAICISGGTFKIESCTITDNFAGEGKGSGLSVNGTGTVHNTIIAGNRNSDVDGAGALTSSGYNLIGRGSAAAAFNRTGDQNGVTDPKLGPLADNGGSTQTREPQPGSPAIDKGDTPLATDQRGLPRPRGAADDIGASEVQTVTPPPPSEKPSLIVTTTQDVVANDGKTSLREAMIYANAKVGADTISFARRVRGTIALASPLPPITDDLMINGPGAPLLAVDGGGKTRLFRVERGVSAEISYLTLSGARHDASDTAGGSAGAVYNAGNLTLRQLALINNLGVEGGAVANAGGSLQVVGCQISGNRATNRGGGLLNDNGTLLVLNSTISNNLAIGRAAQSGGGGVSSFGADANATLEYVTMTGNRAPYIAGNARAGVWIESGVFVPHNSIFYGNGRGDLQIGNGTLISTGYNLIGKTGSASALASTDRIGLDPNLGALTDNGGPTQTQALWPGSPAINAGDPNVGNGSDQRGLGFARLRGGRIDIGAFEVQSDLNKTARTAKPAAPNAAPAPSPSGGNS